MFMNQKDFLIHIHVYYTEMWAELQGCLSSLPVGSDYDLWVTYVHDDNFFLQQVRTAEPNAHILKVENIGYDIGPFVEVLRRVETADYKYIIKLHSKRDVIGLDYPHVGLTVVGGDRWRRYLLSFMTCQNFRKCLTAFEQNPRLGMVGHHGLICRREPDDARAWEESLEWLVAERLPIIAPSFVAGSMFICRAGLMEVVKSLLVKKKFENPTHEYSSTISHTAERFLGHAVAAQGMSIEDVYTPVYDRLILVFCGVLRFSVHWIVRFFYQKKMTRHGGLILKICKIPVYRRRGNR